MFVPLDADFIYAVAPRFSGSFAEKQRAIVEAIAGDMTDILSNYKIDTDLRVANLWRK